MGWGCGWDEEMCGKRREGGALERQGERGKHCPIVMETEEEGQLSQNRGIVGNCIL